MKIRQILSLIAVAALLLSSGVPVMAQVGVEVSINAPAEVTPDSDFTAIVDITDVVDFDAGQYDISFDNSVLRLDDITAGMIGTIEIPVSLWVEMSLGTCRVVQNVPGVPGVSGSGYLAILHFHVIGFAGNSSDINLSNGFLNNNLAEEIPATWIGESTTVTEETAPAAGFSASPTAGIKPLSVQFTDDSTGEITSWLWDFGDGTASEEQNPSHTYTEAGSYTVSLTVTGPRGADTAYGVIKVSSSGGGGGGGGGSLLITVNFLGKVGQGWITIEGLVKKEISVSEVGIGRITIPEGIIALTAEDRRISEIKVERIAEPPPTPESGYLVGPTYEFTPAGATFDPPIELVLSYDPTSLPENMAEEDLTMAYYDTESGWIALESIVDTEAHEVAVFISHFTFFAILGVQASPPELPAEFSLTNLAISPVVKVGESVDISVDITNIGEVEGSYPITLNINGEVEAIKEVTLQGGETKTIAFSVTRDTPETYIAEVGGLTGSFKVVKPLTAWLVGISTHTTMVILGITVFVVTTLGTTVLLLRRR